MATHRPRSCRWPSFGSTTAIRGAAVRSLAGKQDKRAITALVTGLHDSPDVRLAAVQALQWARDRPEVVAALLDTLSADDDESVRANVLFALPLSDRYPQISATLLTLLSDQQPQVRLAAALRLAEAGSAEALLTLCGRPEEVTPRSLEQFADRVYRTLPGPDRATVIRALANLRASTATGRRGSWTSHGFRAVVSPDLVGDEFLFEDIVIFLQGTNAFGNRVFMYVKMPGWHLKRLFGDMQAGKKFHPADYGTVLAAGTGEPPTPLILEMREEYNMIDVPIGL